ncbi:MAG: hypothetical protein IPH12_13450 [Saprospirales bacterium]|nr:hypothetical protein [Saprospirales bacterium]
MKTRIIVWNTLLCFLFSLQLFSQSASIQQLETELRAASGIRRVETLLALSDAYLQTGDYEKAAEFAANATDLAGRIGRSDFKATALNREGKILVITGKRGLFGKDRAAG